MSDRVRWVLSLAAILVLLIAGALQPVSADGVVIVIEVEVQMPTQKAILVYDEQSRHEDLILSVELLGGSEGAWVVPVPSLPEVKAASPDWFEQLGELTRPEIHYRKVTRWTPSCDSRIVTVEVGEEVVVVLGREQVGIYDVSILSADEPGALLDWLNENGYTFPEEGGPLLDSYVEEGGWYFVAARVLPGESAVLDGDVQPLWFSFDAEQPVYPMRLTALMKDNVDVLIYVLANHRMEIAAPLFDTEFAGEITLWHGSSDEADLLKLLTGRSYYVTKLSKTLNAPELVEDVYPQRAASDEDYRQVEYRDMYVCPTPTAGPPATATPSATRTPPTTATRAALLGDRFPGSSGWVVLAVALALLGLVAGLALLWGRRSRRHPEEETDA